jgi:hypothetical protein
MVDELERIGKQAALAYGAFCLDSDRVNTNLVRYPYAHPLCFTDTQLQLNSKVSLEM